MNRPIARPSSTGRPGPGAFQNGSLPCSPGAGRHDHLVAGDVLDPPGADAPSSITSPLRDSYTHSSSSSPTRDPSVVNTPNRPRSGIVPPEVTASRAAPSRARTTPFVGPRRLWAGARRTRRSDSGPPACRAPRGTRRRRAPRSRRRGAPPREDRRPATRRTAVIATSCCASTSSGLRRYASPRCRRRASVRPRPPSEQVAPELRDQLADAGRADLVPGPADPLQPARDRQRASTCTTRSTAPMSIPSSSDDVATIAWQPSALERLLDLEPLLARDRPWWARTSSSSASSFRRDASRSALRRLLTNTIVERCARISSSSTGGSRARSRSGRRRRAGVLARPDAEIRHVVDGHDRSRGRASCGAPASTTATVTQAAGRVEPTEEPRDLLERTLGGRQPDPLGRVVRQRLEPLQRQHQMGAALRRRDRVDLVDDHGPNAPQRLPGGGREHQVERFGRGDEDVGRRASAVGDARGRRCRRCAPPPWARGRAAARARSAACWMPASGARRFFSMSTASARSGETYSTVVRRSRLGGGSWSSRSIAHRNAASVLPEPVGAAQGVRPFGDRLPAPAGHRWAPRTKLRTRRGRRGRRSRGPRMNHATPSFGHRSCQTGLPDLGNGVDMDGSAALGAAKPPGREEPHAAVGLRYHRADTLDEALSLLSTLGDDAQGARRRTEPDPDDEASLRLAGHSSTSTVSPGSTGSRSATGAAYRRAGPSQQTSPRRTSSRAAPDDRRDRAAVSPTRWSATSAHFGGPLSHADPRATWARRCWRWARRSCCGARLGERVIPIGEFLVDRSRRRSTGDEVLWRSAFPTRRAALRRHVPEARTQGRRLRIRRCRRPADARQRPVGQGGHRSHRRRPRRTSREGAAEHALRGGEPTDEAIAEAAGLAARGRRAASDIPRYGRNTRSTSCSRSARRGLRRRARPPRLGVREDKSSSNRRRRQRASTPSTVTVNGVARASEVEAAPPARPLPPRDSRPDRHAPRVRHDELWRLRGPLDGPR